MGGGNSSFDTSTKLSEKMFGFGLRTPSEPIVSEGTGTGSLQRDGGAGKEEKSISSKTMHRSGHVRLFERQLSEFEDTGMLDTTVVDDEMSPETFEMLKTCLNGFSFAKNGYSDVTLEMAIHSMTKETIPAEHKLLIEGRRGDQLYIVEDGQLEVFIRRKLVRRVGRGHILGELALLYDEPRTATVVSVSPCILWTLRRDVFKRVQTNALSEIQSSRSRWLINCPEFAGLTPVDLSRLVESLRPHSFQRMDVLYHEIQLTNRCILIEDGIADVYITKAAFDEIVAQTTEGQRSQGFYDSVLGISRSTHASQLLAWKSSKRLISPKSALLGVGSSDGSDSVVNTARDGLGNESSSRIFSFSGYSSNPAMSARSVFPDDNIPNLVTSMLKKLTETKRTPFSTAGTHVVDVEDIATDPDMVKVCQVQAGCFLGMGILRGMAGMNNSWRWYRRDEILKRGKDISEGAQSPFTIVASNEMKCCIITAERFESLFGSLHATMMKGAAGLARSVSNLLTEISQPIERKFEESDFVRMGLLGTGAFGSVVLAECNEWICESEAFTARGSSKTFNSARNVSSQKRRRVALKIMYVLDIIDQGFSRHVRDERTILSEMSSMFVLKLFGTYKTSDCIVLVTEALPNMELWKLIYEVEPYCVERRGLTLAMIKFFAASIILALSHIHERGAAYRDLKPENVMLDEFGYIRIIDFGFAKKIPYNRVSLNGDKKVMFKSFTLCGTPEYVAPEVVFNLGHDHHVDVWAVGILIFEMLMTSTPFESVSPSGTFRKLAAVQREGFHVPDVAIEKNSDAALWAIVTQLLSADPNERLAKSDGITRGLLDHAFFADVNLIALGNKDITPEFIPQPVDVSSLPPAVIESKPCGAAAANKFSDF